MPPLRIAVPDSLLPLAEAARGEAQLVPVPASAEARQQAREEQIWRERRRGRGASAADAAAALREASCRAVVAVLDRRADAALVSESDAAWRAAWELLEAAGTTPCGDYWVGEGLGGPPLVWVEAQVEAITAAQRALGGQRGATVLLVHWGVRAEAPPAFVRLAETVRARTAATVTWRYSPLAYMQGQLQARTLWAQWRRDVGAGAEEDLPAVVCAPRLARGELAAAWRAAGGTWSGALRAGAEAPAARLAPDARPADVAATLRWLGRC